MNRIILSLVLLASALCAANADETAPVRYVPATDLRIINRGYDNAAGPYKRIPAVYKDSVRPDTWQRLQCSSGIGVRFATDSRQIGVKYRLTFNTHMIHMADTGLKGTDLYIWEGDSVWRHVNTNRPYVKDKEAKITEATYVENLDGKMHDYMVYLPLYDGVEELWIKIDSAATITAGTPELINPRKRIVAYGTSILQGGCASRTGMASTNIISRELNCEVINIGMSGEGKMDSIMARAITRIPDVDLYLIDPVPNCTEMMCDTLTYGFIDIIRKARPEAEIVMLEGPIYPYARYNSFFGNYLPKKNAAFRRNYERLAADAEHPERLHYVTSEGLDGPEDDGTVDGIHLTDLGFLHYANKLIPVLRPLLYKDSPTVK